MEMSRRTASSPSMHACAQLGRRRSGMAAIVPAARRPESERTRASASMRATLRRFLARGRRGRRGEEVCVLSWLRGSSGRRRCDGEAAARARLPQARVRVFAGRARAGGGERVRERPGVVGVSSLTTRGAGGATAGRAAWRQCHSRHCEEGGERRG